MKRLFRYSVSQELLPSVNLWWKCPSASLGLRFISKHGNTAGNRPVVLDSSLYSESVSYESVIKEVFFSSHCRISWTLKASFAEMMFDVVLAFFLWPTRWHSAKARWWLRKYQESFASIAAYINLQILLSSWSLNNVIYVMETCKFCFTLHLNQLVVQSRTV